MEKRIEHFDGGDVVIVDVRDPRRKLSCVSEVICEPGRTVVHLTRAACRSEQDVMRVLGFGSPDETPAYSIRSRSTAEEYWCGPVRLAWG